MKHSFEVEIRETEGRDPELHGVILTEGRAASGGRAEVFTPGSVQWPGDGIEIAPGHKAATESRAHPVRSQNGEIRIKARATDALQKAVKAGAKFMSVEFFALEERTTKAGVREILSALVKRAALTPIPEYDTTAAELREQGDKHRAMRRLWL